MDALAAGSASASSSTAVTSSGSKRSLLGAADEPRRVQPRHFHAGPSLSPAAAVGSVAADAESSAQPPAARLYRHALESIFALLGRRELATALRVSRGWRVAAGSMRSLQLSLTVSKPAAAIRAVAESAMGRHVTSLSVWKPVLLNADSLHIIVRQMPQLRRLRCDLQLPPPDQPLSFPSHLRQLHVKMDLIDATRINTTIAAISRLPLLEDLTITLPEFDPLLSFAPLAALPLLRRLIVRNFSDDGELGDAKADELRAISRLKTVGVPMSLPLLRRLLRQPHQLQWQRISLPDDMDDEAAALLPQLPSLTKINLYAKCARFDWLRSLPNLTDVNLSFSGVAVDDGRAASLVAGLQCCTNIKMLALGSCNDLTAAQLAELLPRLPRLRQLELRSLRIGSLSFLSQPPLTSQLSQLELCYCDQLPLAELLHVHSLRGLTKLDIYCSFAASLDSHSRALFTPPSLILPLLEEFDYTPFDD